MLANVKIFECKSCEQPLPEDQFRIHKTAGRIGKCRECERIYQREWYKSQGERGRKIKRDYMAREREKQRAYLSIDKNRDRMNERRREWHAKRFFYARANRSHFRAAGITAKQLASVWKKQRGICGLTGARRGRDAEIDHIIPIAKGGPDTIDNLRWVSGTANRLKRDLTDAELLVFCNSVISWIGIRIMEALKNGAD